MEMIEFDKKNESNKLVKIECVNAILTLHSSSFSIPSSIHSIPSSFNRNSPLIKNIVGIPYKKRRI